jgi:mono/diheme cytochrome c family protein
LVIINGILAFMLTPGDSWLAVAGTGKEASRFWQAFFNPTYWPNLVMRMLVCTSLAGIWALVSYSKIDGNVNPALKTDLVRWSSKWLLPSFALLPFALAWYLWSVPESQRALLSLGVNTIGTGAFTQVTRTALIIIMTSATIVAVVYFIAWRKPKDFTFGHACAVLMLALMATASGEYAREMLRKPFVIGRHMYSNGVRVKATETLPQRETSYLASSPWLNKDVTNSTLVMGEAMFRGQCASCHTRDVYRSMKKLTAQRNREAIGSVLTMLHEHSTNSIYRAYMPPLVGTSNEITALGDYLASLNATNKTSMQSIAAR